MRRWVHVLWRVVDRFHHFRKHMGMLPRPRPEDRPLVFGIGLHRTGTRSLDAYLHSLGFRTIHWPWMYEPMLLDCLGKGDEDVLDVLDRVFYCHDCFTDVPFPGLYPGLDRRFPKARFILTVREPLGWWRSVVRVWRLDTRKSWSLNPGEIIQYRRAAPFDRTSITLEDRQFLIGKFEQHNAGVADYFSTRKDKLLVLDLEDPEKNVMVSGFLDRPVRPYPHLK